MTLSRFEPQGPPFPFNQWQFLRKLELRYVHVSSRAMRYIRTSLASCWSTNDDPIFFLAFKVSSGINQKHTTPFSDYLPWVAQSLVLKVESQSVHSYLSPLYSNQSFLSRCPSRPLISSSSTTPHLPISATFSLLYPELESSLSKSFSYSLLYLTTSRLFLVCTLCTCLLPTTL